MRNVLKMLMAISILSGLENVFAQKIIKVVPKFVLIDTDQNIGKLGDELNVYRDTSTGRIKVGKIKLLKFSNGQTGAKIIWIEPGLSVSVGDHVQKDEMVPKSDFLFKEEENIVNDQIERIYNPPGPFGIGISRFVPAQDLDRILVSSFCINASFRIGQLDPHYFFISIDYPILDVKSSLNDVSSPSLWSLHFGDHFRVINYIYYDMGAGLYNSKIPEVGDSSRNASSSSKMGFFLGMSVDLHDLISVPITPFVQSHMYETDSDWQLYAIAGITFHI